MVAALLGACLEPIDLGSENDLSGIFIKFIVPNGAFRDEIFGFSFNPVTTYPKVVIEVNVSGVITALSAHRNQLVFLYDHDIISHLALQALFKQVVISTLEVCHQLVGGLSAIVLIYARLPENSAFVQAETWTLESIVSSMHVNSYLISVDIVVILGVKNASAAIIVFKFSFLVPFRNPLGGVLVHFDHVVN